MDCKCNKGIFGLSDEDTMVGLRSGEIEFMKSLAQQIVPTFCGLLESIERLNKAEYVALWVLLQIVSWLFQVDYFIFAKD